MSHDEPGESGDPARMTPLGSINQWLGTIRPAEPTAEAREAVAELVPEGSDLVPWLARFAALIMFSAAIAAFGLLSDSGAVVIGAMLVAPLMTPIMGAAVATVTADNRRLLRSVLTIVLGTALAFAVGWSVSAVAGGGLIDTQALPQEIRSRTFPGLLDLGVAISAGGAAGYIQPRRSAISALPGVGIAVALVPPLATSGITAQLGLSVDARNAFLLYVTNLAAIVFSAGIVLLATGFRPEQTAGRRALRVRLVLTLGAVLAVAIPLTLHTRAVVRDQQLLRAVSDAVVAWDDEVRVVEINADVAGGRAIVELVVVGHGSQRPAWQLGEQLRARVHLPIDLQLLYQQDTLSQVSIR